MLVYYLYYLVILSLGILIGNSNKKTYLAICLFFLFFIIAFRHPSMGIDLHYGTSDGYLGAFEFFANSTWGKTLTKAAFMGYEIGYVIFNKLLSYISVDYQVLLIATTILTIVPVFYTIGKESVDPLISIIVYLGLPSYLMVFSALRQTMAISLLFLTVPLIKRKKVFLQLLLILIASSFHKTALVFILAYPAYHVRIQPALRFHSIFFLLVLYCFSAFLLPLIASKTGYSYIFDNNGANTLFIVYVLIYILCFTIDIEGEYNGLLNLFFIACCLMCFEHLSNIISRLAMYFEMSLILLLPAVFRKYIKEYSVIRLILILCFVLAGLYFLRTTYWTMSYPYHFMWETI